MSPEAQVPFHVSKSTHNAIVFIHSFKGADNYMEVLRLPSGIFLNLEKGCNVFLRGWMKAG